MVQCDWYLLMQRWDNAFRYLISELPALLFTLFLGSLSILFYISYLIFILLCTAIHCF